MNNQNLKNAVLEKIRKGEIHMRPKAYFVMKIIALAFVAVLILITSSLLVSFILFSLRISGRLFLLGFGGRGMLAFFLLFPWRMLLILLLLILFLQWLLKYFQFGYRNPFTLLLSSILLASLAFGAIITATPLHQVLFRHARERRLPIFGTFYTPLRRPNAEDRSVVQGIVTSINGNTFTIKQESLDTDSATSSIETVIAPEDFPINGFIQVGDRIFAAGDIEDGKLRAYGLTKMAP